MRHRSVTAGCGREHASRVAASAHATSPTRRIPSASRRRCTTTRNAAANCACTAIRSRPAATPSASKRAGTSTAELAWMVPQPPSCPVFRAASMSTTSAPRTSPTTSRSGRIRNACRTSCRRSPRPRPSTLAGSTFERDHVRMIGPKLGRILHDHDALRRVRRATATRPAGWSCRSRCHPRSRRRPWPRQHRAAAGRSRHRPSARRSDASRVSARRVGTRSDRHVPGLASGDSTAWKRVPSRSRTSTKATSHRAAGLHSPPAVAPADVPLRHR